MKVIAKFSELCKLGKLFDTAINTYFFTFLEREDFKANWGR